MSGFSPEWLALREPYDLRARNETVLSAVVARLPELPRIDIVDLGCGTGATLRAVSPRFAAPQRWRLADNDPALLRRAAATPLPGHVTANVIPLDLDRDLEAAFEGPIDLVTSSALLDLVSESWIERLAEVLCARTLPFYAALSYDGRASFEPADPFDADIVAAVNAHQRADKGFGPALGPQAAQRAVELFRARGYGIWQDRSDWAFVPDDREIQRQIVTGWGAAAREVAAIPEADVAAWAARRDEFIAAGVSSLRIGHVDLFAAPMGRR